MYVCMYVFSAECSRVEMTHRCGTGLWSVSLFYPKIPMLQDEGSLDIESLRTRANGERMIEW